MTQKKAQLMFPPTSGRLGAVKAGTGISIGVDGTICATGGGGGGVFSADAGNNIWSCTTTAPAGSSYDNFLVGVCAGDALEDALNNIFIGSSAGRVTTSGHNNLFAGNQTGMNNTLGFSNIFLGDTAGLDNTTGFNNNFQGYGAGYSNTTGCSNIFIGNESGCLNTTGSLNTMIGECAGLNNTSGSYSNFFGAYAGYCNTTGGYNNYIGYKAGGNSSYGCYNNFIGACAGQNEAGAYNNYFGKFAGKGIEVTGRIGNWIIDSSTVIPVAETTYYAVEVVTTGGTYIYGTLVRDEWPISGVLLGSGDSVLLSAGGPITDGETIVIPGNQIGGLSPADDATITLYADTWENVNESAIAIGNYAASENNGDSWSNIAIGNYAGQYTGWDGEFNHIFIGTEAGQMAFGGFYNIYIGGSAGQCAGGEASFSNTFIGTFTGQLAADSFYQTFVGAYSGVSVVNPNGWTGPGNQLFGAFSGGSLTTGVANSMFGSYAGYCTTTGTYNSFFGLFAGEGFITGCRNAVFGSYSGASYYYDDGSTGNPPGFRSSTGSNNTNIGSLSGTFQVGDSSGNVAVGYKSNLGTALGLCALTVGTSTTVPSGAYCSYVISTDCVSTAYLCGGDPGLIKVFRDGAGTVCDVSVIDPGFRQQYRNFTCIPGTLIGGTAADDLPIASRTLFSSDDTCNFDNTFIGPFAGQMTAYGTRNFFGGFRAGGWSGDYSTDNVAIGSYAGFCMGGAYNIAIGCCAGALSGGYYNIIVGKAAGQCNQCWFTTLIGGCAGYYNQADGSTFVGQDAGVYNTTGVANTFVGGGAGEQNTTGLWNSFFGAGAGGNVTTGEGNTFVGAAAAQIISTGSRNVAVGCWAMQSAGDVSDNVAIGHCALRHLSNLSGCDSNIAIGTETLRYGAVGSVAIGGCSLSRVIGNCSTAVGYFALKGTGDGTTFLTSSGNSVFGWCSTVGVTTGSENSAFGLFSGLANSTGSLNAFFGSRSGCNNTTGGNNVAIGGCAGTDAVLNLTTQSNQIVVGNNSHTNAFVKIGWTVTSDERDKTCVTSVRHGLDFLDQITPVQFNWKNRETDEVTDETPRYGFLAQDILAAEGDPAILVDTQDPENLKLRESMLIPVLVQAIKELHEEVKALKKQLQP
jgi:hypothetical protein